MLDASLAPSTSSFSASPTPLVFDAQLPSPGSVSAAPPKKSTTSHTRSKPIGHIPRPRNAFILFRSDYARAAQLKSAAASDSKEAENQNDLSREVGRVWRGMTDDQRAPWVALAEEEKKRHATMHPTYKYAPQPRKGRQAKPKESITLVEARQHVPEPAIFAAVAAAIEEQAEGDYEMGIESSAMQLPPLQPLRTAEDRERLKDQVKRAADTDLLCDKEGGLKPVLEDIYYNPRRKKTHLLPRPRPSSCPPAAVSVLCYDITTDAPALRKAKQPIVDAAVEVAAAESARKAKSAWGIQRSEEVTQKTRTRVAQAGVPWDVSAPPTTNFPPPDQYHLQPQPMRHSYSEGTMLPAVFSGLETINALASTSSLSSPCTPPPETPIDTVYSTWASYDYYSRQPVNAMLDEASRLVTSPRESFVRTQWCAEMQVDE